MLWSISAADSKFLLCINRSAWPRAALACDTGSGTCLPICSFPVGFSAHVSTPDFCDKAGVLALDADVVPHSASKSYGFGGRTDDIVALLESGESVVTVISCAYL